jgi:hypothetical protein
MLRLYSLVFLLPRLALKLSLAMWEAGEQDAKEVARALVFARPYCQSHTRAAHEFSKDTWP